MLAANRTLLVVGPPPEPALADALARQGLVVRHHTGSHPVFDVMDAQPDAILICETTDEALAVCAELAIVTPKARVLVMADAESGERLMDAVRAGTVGYLEAFTGPSEIASACRTVADGETAFSARSTAQLLQAVKMVDRGNLVPGR